MKLDKCNKLGYQMSFMQLINLSVLQGSGIGLTSFVIFISDPSPSGKINNFLTKYADDASVLVQEKADVQMNNEFRIVFKWASQNK